MPNNDHSSGHGVWASLFIFQGSAVIHFSVLTSLYTLKRFKTCTKTEVSHVRIDQHWGRMLWARPLSLNKTGAVSHLKGCAAAQNTNTGGSSCLSSPELLVGVVLQASSSSSGHRCRAAGLTVGQITWNNIIFPSLADECVAVLPAHLSHYTSAPAWPVVYSNVAWMQQLVVTWGWLCCSHSDIFKGGWGRRHCCLWSVDDSAACCTSSTLSASWWQQSRACVCRGHGRYTQREYELSLLNYNSRIFGMRLVIVLWTLTDWHCTLPGFNRCSSNCQSRCRNSLCLFFLSVFRKERLSITQMSGLENCVVCGSDLK